MLQVFFGWQIFAILQQNIKKIKMEKMCCHKFPFFWEKKSQKNCQKIVTIAYNVKKGCLRFVLLSYFEYHKILAKYNCEQKFPLEQNIFVGPNQHGHIRFPSELRSCCFYFNFQNSFRVKKTKLFIFNCHEAHSKRVEEN